MSSRTAVPAKLMLSKREPGKRVFTGRLAVSSGGRARRHEKEEPHKPRTFVDSLPIAMCTLEEATKAIRAECDATFGRAHAMSGKAWQTADPGHPKLAHTEFLARKVPWRFLAADGARDVLDEEHHARNPHIELGVSGRGNNQIHALANAFVEATSEWMQAGRRVYMGKRKKDDVTPSDTYAPVDFPTQHAMFMRVKPMEWEVPEAYEGKVCRVIARLEDAAEPTRFWVVCPVRSTSLKPWTAEWFTFVSQLCASAAKAEAVDGMTACLIPIVPGFSKRNVMHGIQGLEHPCSLPGTHPDDVVPPAHIMDAFISGYLQMDECGVESADDGGWDATEEASDDDSDNASDASDSDSDTGSGNEEEECGSTCSIGEPHRKASDTEDEDKEKDEDKDKDKRSKSKSKSKDKAKADVKPMALAFTPNDDILVAVCDTRLAFPLITMVVRNDDLRSLEFHGHDDDDGSDSGNGNEKEKTFIVDWGMLRDKHQWVSWSPRM